MNLVLSPSSTDAICRAIDTARICAVTYSHVVVAAETKRDLGIVRDALDDDANSDRISFVRLLDLDNALRKCSFQSATVILMNGTDHDAYCNGESFRIPDSGFTLEAIYYDGCALAFNSKFHQFRLNFDYTWRAEEDRFIKFDNHLLGAFQSIMHMYVHNDADLMALLYPKKPAPVQNPPTRIEIDQFVKDTCKNCHRLYGKGAFATSEFFWCATILGELFISRACPYHMELVLHSLNR